MLYHLSPNGNLKVLKPRIPECALEMYEDTITPRVCFSDNIEGCLSALQDMPRKYFVYVPQDEVYEKDIYYPTVYDVRDSEYTHEVWVMSEIKVKCIGIIQSSQWDSTTRHKTKRGYTTVFHYPYKWLLKYTERN